ncbi:CvpA family protein [Ammoniphilus sp. 3BR4]|uniref:CvpA family protein n=1 Tax=Ammoniphilus sp. 3BR4 TaxID=3158265 RepID=UPI003466C0DA
MNTVDMGLIGLFLVGLFYGHYRGFVKLAIGLVGLTASLAIAYSFSQDTAVFLQEQFPLPKESANPLFQAILSMDSLHRLVYSAIAFILLFFMVRFLCRILGKVLQSFAELPIISLLNRWLGAILGGLLMLMAVVISVHLADMAPDGKWKKAYYQSVIAQYLLELSPFISQQIRMVPSPRPQDRSDIL